MIARLVSWLAARRRRPRTPADVALRTRVLISALRADRARAAAAPKIRQILSDGSGDVPEHVHVKLEKSDG